MRLTTTATARTVNYFFDPAADKWTVVKPEMIRSAPIVGDWGTVKTLLKDIDYTRIRVVAGRGAKFLRNNDEYVLEVPRPLHCMIDFANLLEEIYRQIYSDNVTKGLINFGLFSFVEILSSTGVALLRIAGSTLDKMIDDSLSSPVGDGSLLDDLRRICAAGLSFKSRDEMRAQLKGFNTPTNAAYELYKSFVVKGRAMEDLRNYAAMHNLQAE